jgi:hypothetical protein
MKRRSRQGFPCVSGVARSNGRRAPCKSWMWLHSHLGMPCTVKVQAGLLLKCIIPSWIIPNNVQTQVISLPIKWLFDKLPVGSQLSDMSHQGWPEVNTHTQVFLSSSQQHPPHVACPWVIDAPQPIAVHC